MFHVFTNVTFYRSGTSEKGVDGAGGGSSVVVVKEGQEDLGQVYTLSLVYAHVEVGSPVTGVWREWGLDKPRLGEGDPRGRQEFDRNEETGENTRNKTLDYRSEILILLLFKSGVSWRDIGSLLRPSPPV